MKFSVCTDALFGGMNTADAIQKCAALGFEAIEFWVWSSKDMKAVKEAADAAQIKIAGFCTKNMVLTDPSERNAYLEGLSESIEVAKAAGAGILISQVGPDTGLPRQEQYESIIEGLWAAAPLLKGTGITLAIEPLNLLYDHAGYFLSSSSEGFKIIKEVGCANIKILFDIYHQQITEGNLIQNITENIDLIGHFHVAGNPGRHEPFIGEINYKEVFAAADKAGYKGYAGLEYWTSENVEESLKKCLELYEG